MNETPAHAPITNFGGNVSFAPKAYYSPRSEEEVLEILRTHRGRRIRAVGSLHAWSDAAVGEDVLLDMKFMNDVVVHVEDGGPWAEVGAGCRVKRLLAELLKQGFTTPSIGLITRQTIAGATATGTHGSGRHSLSHYLQSVRLATYDSATGEPVLRTVSTGPELQAARCSLGLLGVVTAVTLPVRPQYSVEEHFRRHDRLAEVLAAEAAYDLQQFFWVPWRWDFFAQHRRATEAPRSSTAPLYRLYWTVCMDVGLHLIVLSLARLLPVAATRFFYRWIIPGLVPQGWKVVDRSDRQLTMEHALFRHIEIEMFVTAANLPAALECMQRLLRTAGGETVDFPAAERDSLDAAGAWEPLLRLRGQYVHHYPVCIRKILPDDTLISPASGPETYYSVSFISYAHPTRRAGFRAFAAVLAQVTGVLFSARPHWGKYYPAEAAPPADLYPHFEVFRRLAASGDPTGVFRNRWTTQLFGEAALPPPE